LEGYNPTDIAPSFLTRLSNAFKTGAGWVLELFVGLVSIWPLLLIVFAFYFGWKKLKPAKAIAQKS
jgi:ABC-type amino acid transport system permease subunit